MATRRPLSSLLGISMAAVLLLTSCSDGASEEETGQPTEETPSNPADEGSSAPDPTGDQLSHDDMRSAVEARLSGATVTDTDDYWGDLRSIETELKKLDVEPVDCKQYVVESATPVPDGALLVHADTSGADETGESPVPEEPGAEGSSPPAEPEAGEGPAAEGESAAGHRGDAASSAGQGPTAIWAASTSDEGTSGTSEPGTSAPDANEPDEESGSSSDSGSEAATEPTSPSPSPSDDEAQVDDVPGLATDRQVTVYSYADWRAAQSHFAGEDDGVDTCGSYTATRDSAEESGDVEATTTIQSVDLDVNDGSEDTDSDDGSSGDNDSDGSSDDDGVTADEAMAMTQDVEVDGETNRALGVMVRQGPLLVSIAAPMEQQIGDSQAEDAAAALAAEAESLLSDLEG